MRLALLLAAIAPSAAFKLPARLDRRSAFFAAGAAVCTFTAPEIAAAADATTDAGGEKRRNLSPADVAAAVKADIVERQFLVTGQLSRDLYDETCTFKDEIDTYVLDKWIKGTSALFVASQSHVDIVGDVEADANQVKFRFSETLAFNLPLVKPKVPLTGTLILTRGSDGLFTSYNEIWDTDLWATLSKTYL